MGEMHDKRAGTHRLTAIDIATFVVALLATVGLGSLVNYWRRRNDPTEEHERQRTAAQAEELVRKRTIGHETSTPRVGKIVLVAGALVATAVVGHAALFLLFGLLERRAEQADVPLSPLATSAQLPPAPRLQANPSADWQQVRATAEAVLHSYGQGPAGAVRIPIDRAMDLIAQRGLLARNTRPPDGDQQAHQLESSGGQPPGASGTTPTLPTPSATPGTTRNTP